jgi:VIT family.
MEKVPHTGLFKTFVGHTGPELATQEALYGFVMGLIFINSALVGLISYESPWNLVTLIVGMNFVWGFIDMYIFYKMDVSAQKRNIGILKDKERTTEERRDEIYDALGNTIFDVLAEEDKIKATELILNSGVGTTTEIKADRRGMFLSALSCFLITFLTSVPLVFCLLIISDPTDSLHAALILACICLFFIGYKLEPSNDVKYKVRTGASIALLAAGLTIFATFLGG